RRRGASVARRRRTRNADSPPISRWQTRRDALRYVGLIDNHWFGSGGRMIRNHPYRVLFLASAALIAFVFWHHANWGVYVEDDPEPILKFELPWWVQVLVSAAVGAAGAGIIVMVVQSVARRTRRCT